MILTPLQKLPKNVEDLGKLIVPNGLKKLPKVQKIAQSGLTGGDLDLGLLVSLITFTIVDTFCGQYFLLSTNKG